MKKLIAAVMVYVLCLTTPVVVFSADQRIQATEAMVGANHPSGYADTLNRLTLIEHNSDGTHKFSYDIQSYGSNLQTMLSEIGSADANVVISTAVNVGSAFTIPSNISITVVKGGSFVDGGGTIAFNGTFAAGPYQVFSGFSSVDIVFGDGAVNEVIVDWFGVTVSDVQIAVNVAANSNHKDVRFLDKTYSLSDDLYLSYDATYNTGYPSGTGERGRMTVRGSGGILDTSQVRAANYHGTCLVFSADKGIKATGAAASQVKQLRLENLNIIGNHSSFVVQFSYVTFGSGFDHVLVYNSNTSGSGVQWINVWQSEARNLFIISAASPLSGVGLRVRNETNGGGHVDIHGTVIGFGTNAEFGYETYTTSTIALSDLKVTMDLNSAANYAAIFGNGIWGADAKIHAEAYGTYGIWCRANVKNVTIHDGYFSGAAGSTADIFLGYAAAGGNDSLARSVRVINNQFASIKDTGIKVEIGSSLNGPFVIENNYFDVSTGGVGTGIDADATQADKHGLVIANNFFPTSPALASNIIGYDGGYRMHVVDTNGGVVIPWSSNVVPRSSALNLSTSPGFMNMWIDNATATGTIMHTLPTSTPGLSVGISRTATQTVRVDPQSSDAFRGQSTGKYLSLDSDGSSVWLKCLIAGTWDIISSSGTISYEP